jgi:multidrug efflux system outer membrane protein
MSFSRRLDCRPGLALLTLALALSLAGCLSLAPDREAPEAEQALPSTFDRAGRDAQAASAASDTSGYAATAWWTGFGDPALDAVVDSALARNRDLVRTEATVRELAGQFRIARAALFPSLEASANAQRQSQPANVGIGGAIGGAGGGGGGGQQPQQTIDRFAFNQYTASLSVSYALDVWGGVQNQRNASLQRFFASVDDLQRTRQQVIAQTINAYAQVAVLRRQVRLNRRSIDLVAERLALTEDRYDRGLVTPFELYTQRRQLRALRAEQPQLESQLYDARGQLAVLLGRFTGEEADALDAMPDDVRLDLSEIPAGLPSELLMARPDVRAALRRLEAARLDVGVERARLYPSFSLTAEGGLQSGTLDEIVDVEQRFYTLIGAITAPLFQGGQLRAQVDAAQARLAQQVAAYEQTLLTAFNEVKTTLVAYEEQRRRLRFLQAELDDARASAQNQERRVQRGVGDYLAFLDARREVVNVRSRVAAAQQAVVNARVAVHQALGGAWIDPTPVDDPRLFRDTYDPDDPADPAGATE